MKDDDFFVGMVTEILDRRTECCMLINDNLAHLDRLALIIILTSWIPIAELENAMPTIIGAENMPKERK